MADVYGDDLLAVVAHSLLNSMAVVSGNAETLLEHWARLDDEQRADLLRRIVMQARHVNGVLTDLVRSGRPELLEALEQIRSGDV
jgi:signal transduction histidine kinase